MTILTVDKKEFEKKVGNKRIYKFGAASNFRIYPSNLSWSLDGLYSYKIMKGGRFKYL